MNLAEIQRYPGAVGAQRELLVISTFHRVNQAGDLSRCWTRSGDLDSWFPDFGWGRFGDDSGNSILPTELPAAVKTCPGDLASTDPAGARYSGCVGRGPVFHEERRQLPQGVKFALSLLENRHIWICIGPLF